MALYIGKKKYAPVVQVQAPINLSSILDAIYPIGSIYIGTMATCPIASLGVGTWVLKSKGRVLQGSDDNHIAGDTISAGLPNIKGSFKSWNSKIDIGVITGVSTGAFIRDKGTSTMSITPGDYTNSDSTVSTSFDASNYNSIYSDSVNTVQPPAYVVNIWERTE